MAGKGQVRVVLLHGKKIAVIVGADEGVFTLQLVENLVHDVGLHQGLLLYQKVGGLLDLGGILSVIE